MLHTHCIMWYMFAYTHVPTSLEAFPAFVGVSVAEKMLHTIRAAVLAARVCIYATYSPHVCTETNHLFYMCMQVYTILTTCVQMRNIRATVLAACRCRVKRSESRV